MTAAQYDDSICGRDAAKLRMPPIHGIQFFITILTCPPVQVRKSVSREDQKELLVYCPRQKKRLYSKPDQSQLVFFCFHG